MGNNSRRVERRTERRQSRRPLRAAPALPRSIAPALRVSRLPSGNPLAVAEGDKRGQADVRRILSKMHKEELIGLDSALSLDLKVCDAVR